MSRKQERRIDTLRWVHRAREWEIRTQSLRIAHVQRQTPMSQLTKGLLNALTKGTMVAEPPPARPPAKPLEYKPRERIKPTRKQEKRATKRLKCEHDYEREKQTEMDRTWNTVNVKCSRCGLRGWLDLKTKKVNHWVSYLYE